MHITRQFDSCIRDIRRLKRDYLKLKFEVDDKEKGRIQSLLEDLLIIQGRMICFREHWVNGYL